MNAVERAPERGVGIGVDVTEVSRGVVRDARRLLDESRMRRGDVDSRGGLAAREQEQRDDEQHADYLDSAYSALRFRIHGGPSAGVRLQCSGVAGEATPELKEFFERTCLAGRVDDRHRHVLAVVLVGGRVDHPDGQATPAADRCASVDFDIDQRRTAKREVRRSARRLAQVDLEVRGGVNAPSAAVTAPTWIGTVLGLSKLPESVTGAPPGKRPVTVDVWCTTSGVVGFAVAAVPLPPPPVVQYALATPAITNTARTAKMAIRLCRRMILMNASSEWSTERVA